LVLFYDEGQYEEKFMRTMAIRLFDVFNSLNSEGLETGELLPNAKLAFAKALPIIFEHVSLNEVLIMPLVDAD